MDDLRQQILRLRDWMIEFQDGVVKRIPDLQGGKLTSARVDVAHQEKVKEHLDGATGRALELWQGVNELTNRAKERIESDLEAGKQAVTLVVSVDSTGNVNRLQMMD
jgi:hypothetical protein